MNHEKPLNDARLGEWTFQFIDLKDKTLFDDYMKESDYPANLWSSNFAYLWAISQSQRRLLLWKIVDGMLVTFILRKENGLNVACLPFGIGNVEDRLNVIYKCLRYCNGWNNDHNIRSVATVRTINQSQLAYLQEFTDFNKYFYVRGLTGIERHYSVQNLVTLTGKRFRNIRSSINQFLRNYPQAIIREYQATEYQELLSLAAHWKRSARKRYTNIFDNLYYREIIKHYRELDHLVLVVEIDGTIVGMISGGALPTGQSWGCLTKKRDHFDGLNEMMAIEFAREIHRRNPQVELINVGSDLGAPGLQTYKDKFRPILNLKRYRLALQ